MVEVSTENVALALAISGYVPMGLAIRVLWVALQRANRREIEAAHKSADRTNAYASQLHVLSTATKAVARQLRALRDRIGDEVAAVGADISKILKHLGID